VEDFPQSKFSMEWRYFPREFSKRNFELGGKEEYFQT